MAISLYDSTEEKKSKKLESGIYAGQVLLNCDPLKQGKVLVRIPSLDQEIWARVSAPGAGSGGGMLYIPHNDDEVLVALVGNEPSDAFIIGGLWNTEDTPPLDDPLEAGTKRVIKTGLAGGQGHSMEFDDLKQSVTITTSTEQTITMDPFQIQLANAAGTISITMDNKSQKITIWAANEISISAGTKISLNSTQISINAVGTANIMGAMVKINS